MHVGGLKPDDAPPAGWVNTDTYTAATGWIDASDLRPVPDNQEVRYFSVAMPELPLTPARHIPTRCGWSELEQSAH